MISDIKDWPKAYKYLKIIERNIGKDKKEEVEAKLEEIEPTLFQDQIDQSLGFVKNLKPLKTKLTIKAYAEIVCGLTGSSSLAAPLISSVSCQIMNKRKLKKTFLLPVLLIPICYFCGCAFVGTPTTSDHWELIRIGQYRLESGRAFGARNVLEKALLEAEKHNDKFALAVIHNDLGLTYIRENEDTVEAEKDYTIAREIAESNRFRYELAYNYLNTGYPLNSSIYHMLCC